MASPDRVIINARYSENASVIRQWLENNDRRQFNTAIINSAVN